MISGSAEHEGLKRENSNQKSVCIIGAGVAGLVSAKVLKRDGFDVTVFEKESSIGGVWAECRAYPGLRSNNPREAYAFSDFDYPDSSNEFPAAEQIRNYLESYVIHFKLEPHISLETEVLSVSRLNSATDRSHPGFRVRVQPVNKSRGSEVYDFDFVVVCNGVFSEPYIPDIRNRDCFEGKILHSSQFTDKDVINGKKVIVIGAGKSALDCAAFTSDHAERVTLVYRKPHWMIPRYFGNFRVDYVLFNRFSEQIFPAYHRATKAEKAFRKITSPIFWLWRTIVSKIVIHQSGMPGNMIPDEPVTSGIENNGIGVEFFRALDQGRVHTKQSQIHSFSDENKMELDNGEMINADVVIFATGWRQNISFLDSELKKKIRQNGWFQLYRHILPPNEQQLGFIGYASSGNAPLTSEISAHWLSQHFRGELPLPDISKMEQQIDEVRKWTQDIFPRRNDGYFIGAYVSNYIDELMQDMSLPTRRSNSFFSEYWDPLWAKRYRSVKNERLQLRENRVQQT